MSNKNSKMQHKKCGWAWNYNTLGNQCIRQSVDSVHYKLFNLHWHVNSRCYRAVWRRSHATIVLKQTSTIIDFKNLNHKSNVYFFSKMYDNFNPEGLHSEKSKISCWKNSKKAQSLQSAHRDQTYKPTIHWVLYHCITWKVLVDLITSG